jgi:hypothetical protein
MEEVKTYLRLNADITGFDSPMKKVTFVLTHMKGPDIAGWCKVCIEGTLGTEQSNRTGAPSHNCTVVLHSSINTPITAILSSLIAQPLDLRRKMIPNKSRTFPPSQPLSHPGFTDLSRSFQDLDYDDPPLPHWRGPSIYFILLLALFS